jgi:low affinity Fe/Cu permease
MTDHTQFSLAFKPLDKWVFDGSPEAARKTLRLFGLSCGAILLHVDPTYGGSEILYGVAYMTQKVANYTTLEAHCVAAGPAGEAMRKSILTATTMLCQLMVLCLADKLSIYSSEIDILTGENTIKTLSSVFISIQNEFIIDSPAVQTDLDYRINQPITARNYAELQQQLSDKKVAIRQSIATGNGLSEDRMYRAFLATVRVFGVHFNAVIGFYENAVLGPARTTTALIDRLLLWALENADLANSGFAHYVARHSQPLTDATDGSANRADGAVKGPKDTTPGKQHDWDLCKQIRAHGDNKFKMEHAADAKFCIIHGWNATHTTHPVNGAHGCMVLSRERRPKKT